MELPQVTHIPSCLQGCDPMSNSSKVPECIMDKSIIKVNNNAETQYLVKWVDMPLEESTWIAAPIFEQHFLDFDFET